MRATRPTPVLAFAVVLVMSVWLPQQARAEYPFEPMFDQTGAYAAGSDGGDYGPMNAPGSFGPPPGSYQPGDPNVLVDDAYAYEGGYPFDQPVPQDELFGFEAAVWPGFISGTLQPGTERSIYGGEWFQPLYQDGRSLWYFDFRGQTDSDSADEFNLGTGIRILSDPGWIFGAYAFWDHLRSVNGNSFNQGMIGVEAMDVFWDARMNIYFPESGGESVGAPRARVSGGNVVVQTGLERAYWGLDLEVGNLLWAWGPQAQHELRGFLGLYHFDHSSNATESITGPRARLEWRYYDLPYFGPGSRLTLGLTAQTDRVRDGQLFFFARMRIPLDPWAHDRKRLSPLHRRMLDHVVRDVDVVTAVSNRSESAINSLTGREIEGFAKIDAGTANTQDLLEGLEPDSLIVIDGSKGDIQLDHAIDLKPGQTVLGGGQSLVVRGERTGARATFNAGGSRPRVDFSTASAATPNNNPAAGAVVDSQSYTGNSTPTAHSGNTTSYPGFQMDDHTRLVGVDIHRPFGGVTVDHAEDVLVQDVEITDFFGAGIEVTRSEEVTLDNVRIRDSWKDPYTTVYEGDMVLAHNTGAASPGSSVMYADPDSYPGGVGILVQHSSDVEIVDSHIEDTLGEGIRVAWSQNVAIRNTTIRDTGYDGIRLRDTENVEIDQVDLKNVAESYWHPYMGSVDGWAVLYQPRHLGGIALEGTLNTSITNSSIHNSAGIGIVGENADSTLIDNVEIAYVEHGVKMLGGSELVLRNSTILLPNEEYRASRASRTPPGMFYTMDAWVPDHGGVILHDLLGEVIVRETTISGGFAGAGVEFDSQVSGFTQLRITGNSIDKSGSDPLVVIGSGAGHSLKAWLGENDVQADGQALWVNLAGAGSRDIDVDSNQFADGRVDVELFGTTDVVDLDFVGNFLGGDPMGRIFVDGTSSLDLLYRRNTSTPGAEVMIFENAGGSFDATLDRNDHTPTFIGVID